jgi:hypothetical protein
LVFFQAQKIELLSLPTLFVMESVTNEIPFISDKQLVSMRAITLLLLKEKLVGLKSQYENALKTYESYCRYDKFIEVYNNPFHTWEDIQSVSPHTAKCEEDIINTMKINYGFRIKETYTGGYKGHADPKATFADVVTRVNERKESAKATIDNTKAELDMWLMHEVILVG